MIMKNSNIFAEIYNEFGRIVSMFRILYQAPIR